MATEVHHSVHIPSWKKEDVEEIRNLSNEYPVVGIVAMRGIPAKQLQNMRAELRGTAALRMYRNNLIELAIRDNKELAPLLNYIEDQTAFIFTNLDPFKLRKTLEKSKTHAPIKGGAISPRDIVVHKGPTSFNPGPIAGELQQAGIPAGIAGGKVVIKKTVTAVHTGEVVSGKLAEMLARLEIYPLEVGLDLRAVCEDGLIYQGDVLAIDEEQYASDIATATQMAFNLAINIVYPCSATIETLLQKALSDSRNLAVNAVVFEKDAIDIILAKARMESIALSNTLKEMEDMEMEYIYAALLAHNAGKDVTEENVSAIIKAAGIDVDEVKVKALVSAVEGVDIDDALSKTAFASAAVPAAQVAAAPTAAPEDAAENEEEAVDDEKEKEKAEEEGIEGLGALFG